MIKSNKINNIQFKFNKIKCRNRKTKIELEEDIENYGGEKELKRKREEQCENGNLT